LVPDRRQSESGGLVAAALETPAVHALRRRVENGGVLSLTGICLSAQPFLAVLLRHLFPGRPIMVVAPGVKPQETFQQDLETWLGSGFNVQCSKFKVQSSPFFYPAWDILPHEGKLPHSDVISERLETLVALVSDSKLETSNPKLIVTQPAALMQRTFVPDALTTRLRRFERGARANPLDLVEWLEEQGYEPEAKVTQKGEIALRGGIVDLFPPTSPWPVRLEFFGEELESLRFFDPATQISREEIAEIVIPPAGELGILKQAQPTEHELQPALTSDHGAMSKRPEGRAPMLATLLDYFPRETILVICEPEIIAEHAAAYAAQTPADDPFFIG
jgi:transcription-repair coupling factor (superfamily II helicase)